MRLSICFGFAPRTSTERHLLGFRGSSAVLNDSVKGEGLEGVALALVELALELDPKI